MKLQYRSNSYEQNSLLMETTESQIIANYRGATYKIRQRLMLNSSLTSIFLSPSNSIAF